MTLFDEPSMSIAHVKRLTINPLIVLPALPASRYSPSARVPWPSISISGEPAKPACVVPSMISASVMNGRSVPVTLIVRTPAPGMLK